MFDEFTIYLISGTECPSCIILSITIIGVQTVLLNKVYGTYYLFIIIYPIYFLFPFDLYTVHFIQKTILNDEADHRGLFILHLIHY